MEYRVFEDCPWYHEFELSSLDDYIEWQSHFTTSSALSPIDGMIFRGHSLGETYKLIPTAHRQWKDGLPEIYKFSPVSDITTSLPLTYGGLVTSELASLLAFFRESNRQGLYLPQIERFADQYFKEYNVQYLDGLDTWYTRDILELAALAQHYGMQTRLLDWTFNINVAFYFALEGIVRKLYESKKNNRKVVLDDTYAIWGINIQNIASTYEDYWELKSPIQFFVPTYANNQNLRAQEGVLSYKEERNIHENRFKPYTIKAFDEELNEFFDYINREHTNMEYSGILICKMIFPVQNAVSEFEYIRRQGYHAAKLFPGYRGVVQKLQEDEWVKYLKGHGVK